MIRKILLLLSMFLTGCLLLLILNLFDAPETKVLFTEKDLNRVSSRGPHNGFYWLFSLNEPLGQILVTGRRLSKADKGPHDRNVDLHRTGAFENAENIATFSSQHPVCGAKGDKKPIDTSPPLVIGLG